jgi:Vacuolar protein sorting-associated protein 62
VDRRRPGPVADPAVYYSGKDYYRARPVHRAVSAPSLAFVLPLIIALCIAALTFVHDEAARLRGPCIESAPSAQLVGLPPTQPGEAVPAGPAPGDSNVSFREPPIQQTDAADAALVRLATAYEPVLEVAKADRFWPVAVPTVLALSMGDRRTQFVGADGKPHDALLSELRAGGSETEYIDYPAAIENVQDEFCSVGRALGIAAVDLARWSTFPNLLHPQRSAEFYFLARAAPGGEDFQYWFFYPYNYLPVITLNPFFMNDPLGATLVAADFHEGDFEHVTVRLRRGADGELQPASIEYARHKNEDRTLAWGSHELERDGTHPVVYAGFGGHASYNACGKEVRPIAPLVSLLDWALCNREKVFALGPDVPLVDLRTVPWACWPGHFGEVPPDPLPELRVAGPRSPLFQAGNAATKICPPAATPAP